MEMEMGKGAQKHSLSVGGLPLSLGSRLSEVRLTLRRLSWDPGDTVRLQSPMPAGKACRVPDLGIHK